MPHRAMARRLTGTEFQEQIVLDIPKLRLSAPERLPRQLSRRGLSRELVVRKPSKSTRRYFIELSLCSRSRFWSLEPRTRAVRI